MSDEPPIRDRVTEWLDHPLTRRKFIPEYVILFAVVILGFWQLQRITTASEVDRISVEARADRQRCVDLVERSTGLRFVLDSLYDNIEVLVGLVETNAPDFPNIDQARERVNAGREQIDIAYPALSIEDCISTPTTSQEESP